MFKQIPWKRIGAITMLAITSIVFMIFVWVFIQFHNLPKPTKDMMTVAQPSKILAKDGSTIWTNPNQHVTNLSAKEIPDLYKKALIATEDENFYKNKGVSGKGMANAIFTTIGSKILPGKIEARGGSTLEQQLIKNTFFDHGRSTNTATRKVQEWFLAGQLDKNFTKQEILAMYVNHLQLNEGDTGVGASMKTLFGKNASDYKEKTAENIAEQAYLARLGNNPTAFSLYDHPKARTDRAHTVLGIMKNNHLITDKEYQDAMKVDLVSKLKPRAWEQADQINQNNQYKPYVDGVLWELGQEGYNLDKVSLTVKTFLDPKIYNDITNTVRSRQYYQDGDKEQIAVTVMDHNGIVQGMVGSRHPGDEYNRAIQKTRSSGSSLKPFTAYGPLLQYFGNDYNTASTFDSSNYQYPGTNVWMKNYAGATYRRVDMQKALRLSLNTPVARIDDQILGSNRMKTFLQGLGLDSKDSYSAADGIGLNISTLQAAAAYNALNNNGTYTRPRFIDQIVFQDGSKTEVNKQSKNAMNASTAYVLNQMLRGVVSHGYTAAEAEIGQYQGYAGKTGLVGFPDGVNAPATYGVGSSDAWFNSITKDGYAISVWQGYDSPNDSPQVADDKPLSQQLGRDLQKQLNGNKTIENWSQPDGVKALGGQGLNANYAVTNAKDITNTTVKSVDTSNQLKTLKDWDSSNISQKADYQWSDKINQSLQPFYKLWKSSNDVLKNSNVISNDLWSTLKGGQ